MPFLSRWLFRSLSISEKVTGTTIPSTILPVAMISVFQMAVVKPGIMNRKRKFRQPTHADLNRPRAGM